MNWSSSTHPISDIRDWKTADRLELQPDFQRNEVWSRAAKIALIDTILLDIPMPKIYIKAVMKNEQTYRVVIDGQQRLTAIIEFLNNKFRLRVPHITLSEYDKKLFRELPEDIRNKVLSYKIDFNEIVNPSSDDVRDLYARVNKYTVQLNKQELRRADYPGEFLNLAEELSDLPFFDDSKFFSSGQKRRMLDVEYIEELLCIMLEGEQDKKDSIDEFCEKYTVLPFGKDNLKSEFIGILKDISTIFSDGISLTETRFKQKSDFYSLFSIVLGFKRKGKTIIENNLTTVRKHLITLDREIAPHSENEGYSEYAIRCISDANSLSSRIWRKKFLFDYLQPLYCSDKELED